MYLYDSMIKDSTTVRTVTEQPKELRIGDVAQDLEALLYAVGQQQDRAAFIEIFEYFAPRIKSFLIKRGANIEAADELAQETMLTLWNKASSFDPKKAKASTWIYTIARNKHIDTLRKNKPQHVIPYDTIELKSDDPDPSEEMMHTQETHAIAKALETLPEDQAILIRQSFFEGKSHGEIAKDTKIPLGTIKSRIRMALEKLRGEENVKALK